MSMREIKFRGKRADNGEWVVGDLVNHYENQRRFIACDQFAYTYSECGIDRLVTERFYEIIPETVGQSTGFKDGNGVEIYEGDVIQEFAGEHAQGVWEYSNVSVVEDLRWIPESLGFADCTYIIGNIHDNPELTEAKKKLDWTVN